VTNWAVQVGPAPVLLVAAPAQGTSLKPCSPAPQTFGSDAGACAVRVAGPWLKAAAGLTPRDDESFIIQRLTGVVPHPGATGSELVFACTTVINIYTMVPSAAH
jgi:hypothetical protein